MPLPFALNHINLWLIADGDGWTIIDTGYNTDETRQVWENVFDELLDGKPVKRIIVTHFHPDHVSLAGWLLEKWDAPYLDDLFRMDAGPNSTAMVVQLPISMPAWNSISSMAWSPSGIDGYRETRPDFSKIILPLPTGFRRMVDGEAFPIGDHNWRVITGAGHSPEHAALWCKDLNVLISGDQILPRISTNVSLQCNEPEGNPLQLYLDSLEKFRDLPKDAFILPSHDRPFYGLHDRIDALGEHHADRLDAAAEACAEPKTSRELIPFLFKRELDRHQLGFAIGEAMAHANYLVAVGRLSKARDENGLIRYSQI